MKKFLLLLIPIIIFSCKKDNFGNRILKKEIGEFQVCKFGYEDSSAKKRQNTQNLVPSLRRGPKKQNLPSVIYVDFDGEVVKSQYWAVNGPINCSPANLSQEEIENIIKSVSEDFSPFDVLITTNEADYQNANPVSRIRVIVTETWEWFGLAGGVSYIGSFVWGNDVPCFVFSSLLRYSPKNIAEAVSHEVGHTLGLNHQSLYNNNCVKLSEYNPGVGTGPLSWAPIMGVGYSKNVTLWNIGPSSYGCDQIQNDISIINNILPNVVDNYSDNFTKPSKISIGDTTEGIINNGLDVDVFWCSASNFNLSVGGNGNTVLKVEVFDANKNLVYTESGIQDVSIISINSNTNLNYIKISTSQGFDYIPNFDMLRGEYIVSIN